MNKFAQICLVATLFFFCFSKGAFAHTGGGPPFLTVNGTYSQTNPYYLGPSKINVPQDIISGVYAINQPIHFAIDTTKLLVSPEIVANSTFHWYVASGDNFENISTPPHTGLKTDFIFNEPKSYLITLEVKSPGDQNFTVIDTVQINTTVNTAHQLPQITVEVDSPHLKTIDKTFFKSNAKLDVAAKNATYLWDFGGDFGDGQLLKGQQVAYTFRAPNFSTYLYNRVIDDKGYINDVGFTIEGIGGKLNMIPFGSMPKAPLRFMNAETKTAKNISYPTLLTVLIAISIVTTLFFLTRKKKKHK